MIVNWEAVKPILGKVSDPLIAECFNVSRERVRQIREKFGIDSYIPYSRPQPSLKIPEEEFNQFTNYELSKKYEISANTASNLRHAAGVLTPRKAWINSQSERRNRILKEFAEYYLAIFESGTKEINLIEHDIILQNKYKISLSCSRMYRKELGIIKRQWCNAILSKKIVSKLKARIKTLEKEREINE